MATIFLVILTTHFVTVTSQLEAYNRSNQKNYTSESLYSANLNSLLPSISSNIGNTGFYNTSVGQVNAIALCRGDIQPDECRRCVNIVAQAILQLCPNQMQATRWSQYCMLRYSDEPIFGNLATSPSRALLNGQNATSPNQFKEVRRTLMDELRGQAANGGALRKAAAESRDAPDLWAENCASCLVRAAQDITECCDNKIGVRIYMPSCFIRYESAPFYNITRLQEPLESPSSPSSGNDAWFNLI